MASRYHGGKSGGRNKFEYMKAQAQTTWLIKQIYSCVALTLYEDANFTVEEIETLFENTQAIWNDSIRQGYDIQTKAEQTIGCKFFRKDGNGNFI